MQREMLLRCLTVVLALVAASRSSGDETEKKRTAKGDEPAARQKEIVGKIISVEYAIEESEPPNLVVEAVGQVPTNGFKNPQLVRVVYVTPPADGIQDYVFYAEPPTGISLPALTPIKAANKWKAYGKEAPWLKGLRVHGIGDGIVVKMLSEDGHPPEGKDTFVGVSKKGNLQEALDDAIQKARAGLATELVQWHFVSAFGESGGFAGAKDVKVTIRARIPSADM